MLLSLMDSLGCSGSSWRRDQAPILYNIVAPFHIIPGFVYW